MTRHFIVLALLCQLATTVLAADAPSYFRKSQGAVGDDFALPEQFGAKEQLVWRQEVSPGISTPCVHGDLVVLTTWDKKAKELLAWEPKVKFMDGLHRTIDWYFETKDREKVREVFRQMLTER